MKYDLNDITLLPREVSDIFSRKEEVMTRHKDGSLPICTNPKMSVVCDHNERVFKHNNVVRIQTQNKLPILEDTYKFLNLEEFLDVVLLGERVMKYLPRVMINFDNGAFNSITKVIREVKTMYPNIEILVNNVRNPKTFKLLSEAGANGVILNSGLETHAVFYPMASLIIECQEYKIKYGLTTDIIVENNINNLSDMVKALALGANYIMIGTAFKSCIDSSGKNYLFNIIPLSQKYANLCYWYGLPIYKKHIPNNKRYRADFAIHQIIDVVEEYLSEQMFLLGYDNLGEFIGNTDYSIMSNHAYERTK